MRIKNQLLLIFVIIPHFIFANVIRTDSPNASIRTFVDAFKDWETDGKQEVLKTLDLDFLPPSLRQTQGPVLAEYVKEVLDRTLYLDFEAIPSTTKDSIFVLLEHQEGSIILHKSEYGQWRISQKSLKKIENFYQEVKTLPVLNNVSQYHEQSLTFRLKENYFGRNSWLGKELFLLQNWQWTGLFGLFLMGAILQGVFRISAPRIASWFQRKYFREEVTAHKAIIYKPLGHLIMSLVWLNALPLLALPLRAEQILFVAAKIFFSLSLIWTLWRVVDWLTEILYAKALQTESKFDDLLVPFIKTGMRVFVVALTLILTAETLNLPIQNLIAGLGIGAMAFAFAAKDTIENLFGSLTILLDRPFNIGDWVVIDGVEGTVEKLGFRSTRIRTFYNSQITLPNSKMISATVDNMGERQYRRIKTHLGLTYDTPAEKIQLFVEGIRTLIQNHPYTRKDYYQVYFNQYSAFSLDVLLYCFLEVPDWSTELQEKERLFLDILKLSQEIGVSFAFPTQTIHMADDSAPDTQTFLPHEQVQGIAKNMSQAHFINGQKPSPPKF